MTAFLLVVAVWAVLSWPVAIFTAKFIHLTDEQSEAERAAARQRHPSGSVR